MPDGRLEGVSRGPEARHSIRERGLPTSATFGGRRPLNPSDAAEDSLAYNEALEGGNGRGDGCVPFYPGMAPLYSIWKFMGSRGIPGCSFHNGKM